MLEPADELAAVQALQAETEEATVILQYTGGHPMIAFPDVKPALVICEKGGSLSAGMVLNVAELLRASRAAQDALLTERENTPILRAKAEGLFVARNIERDITDAIISEDEIADRSPPLHKPHKSNFVYLLTSKIHPFLQQPLQSRPYTTSQLE